ncbi:MAG: DUF2341 domain-containing protein, partial [bacterium]|nr:DUF2341 domain-containing protein [bacterium]
MSFLLINCSEMGSWDLIEKQKNQTDPVAWKKRIQLTFQNAASTENLVNFPVLIKLTTARITYSLTVSGGEYIRIYDSDTTTELAFEIESWDPNGDSYIWVKVPQIDASSNTDHIWIYYDNVNSLADGQNETVVWTNLYEAVWHLNESGTGTRFDATENLNDGTPGGYEGDEAITGQVGGADEFDNIDDNIAVSSINSYVSLTFEAWIKRNGTGDWDAIINYDGWNSGGI